MTAIGLALILLLLSLVLLFRFCRLHWDALRTRMKRRLIVLLSAHLFLLFSLAYAAWPLLPVGQAQRSEAIEQFLNTLSAGQTESVVGD